MQYLLDESLENNNFMKSIDSGRHMHQESISPTLVVKKKKSRRKKKASQIQQKQKWRKTFNWDRRTHRELDKTSQIASRENGKWDYSTFSNAASPFFAGSVISKWPRVNDSQNLNFTLFQSRTQCWLYPINLWCQSALLFPVLHSIKSELCLKRLRAAPAPAPPQYTKVFIVPRWWPLRSVHKFELCKIFNAPDISCSGF